MPIKTLGEGIQNLKQGQSKAQGLRGQGGQIVLEYVLLLIIGVSIAISLSSLLVSRNPEDQGLVISTWGAILDTISTDMADDFQ